MFDRVQLLPFFPIIIQRIFKNAIIKLYFKSGALNLKVQRVCNRWYHQNYSIINLDFENGALKGTESVHLMVPPVQVMV